MKINQIAVDATSIISFLIGGKAVWVFDSGRIETFMTTAFNIEEVHHLIPKLAGEYDYNKHDLFETLEKLEKTKLTVYPRPIYGEEWETALELIGATDKKDVDLLALALKFKCPLWSNDEHFQSSGIRGKVQIYRTGQLLRMLGYDL